MDYKENFFNLFKLPIEYLENKKIIETHMKSDLELVNTHDDIDDNKSIYMSLFDPETIFGKKCIDKPVILLS